MKCSVDKSLLIIFFKYSFVFSNFKCNKDRLLIISSISDTSSKYKG